MGMASHGSSHFSTPTLRECFCALKSVVVGAADRRVPAGLEALRFFP